MKKRIIAMILCVMTALCGCGQTNSTPEFDKSVSMTASEVAERMGIGLNIGNTMEAYESTNCEKSSYEWIPICGDNTPEDYETRWGAVVTTQKIINGIKAEGFNTIRIPVFWGNMMENDGTWTINPDYLERVKEIVDYCMKADMFAVVNCHHFDEFIIRRNNVEECSSTKKGNWLIPVWIPAMI